ncbi:MAG: DUF1569 domain-containing protein [Bacteroidota bacterium]
MNTILDEETANHFIRRINTLQENTIPKWGKMSCAQMLAHCSGAFEESTHKLNLFSELKIRFLRRNTVIGNKPYPKNMKTAKRFTINEKKHFEVEKARLIKGIERVQALDVNYLLNKKHPIFGRITQQQWHTFFTKHLDHHLRQFGV